MPRAGGTPVGGHSSGSYPPTPGGGAADNRNLWIALGTIAAVALIVIIVVIATSGGDESGGSEGGYTDAVEADFLESCVAGEEACQCAYDLISDRIDYDRFVEINAELEANPDAQVDELDRIKTECGIA